MTCRRRFYAAALGEVSDLGYYVLVVAKGSRGEPVGVPSMKRSRRKRVRPALEVNKWRGRSHGGEGEV
jgi:hypothetical protein